MNAHAFSDKDRDEIALCRSARNRIVFALLLGGVRLLGRFPYDVELIPKDLLARIRRQLEVDAPLFLNYPQRRATRQERIERIRQDPGLRPFIESDRDGVKAFVDEQARACSSCCLMRRVGVLLGQTAAAPSRNSFAAIQKG